DERLRFRLVSAPQDFSAAVRSWSLQPRLWIDIEVADYYGRQPRVSTLQVRDSAGVTVVDCLGETEPVLHHEFVPHVMGNPEVEKWAHQAAYERRFLGGDRVQNLRCTLTVARSLPYYRLPTTSRSLAGLAACFWGVDVDKSLQTH